MYLKFDINTLSLEEQKRLFQFLKEKFDKAPGSNPQTKKHKREEYLNFELKDLDLYPRALNLLTPIGVLTVKDLCNCSQSQLKNIDGFGNRCVNEIEYLLSDLGLKLKTDGEIH